jgi:dihydroneopterin aldolase
LSRSLSISLEGIELRGRCGVTAEERMIGQTLGVNVRLEPAECRGVRTDELDDTVNYGRVAQIVRDVIEGGEFKLLERLGTVISDTIWDEFDLRFLEVSVAKIAPPTCVPAKAARVEIVRTA